MRTPHVIAAAALVVAAGASAQDATTTAHDFTFHAQATALYTADGEPWTGPTFEEGQEVNLGDYAGHPILVVNTAAHCGFTPQFEGLQGVWNEYRDDGLVMIGVHANNFREQGGSETELAEQCALYNVDFPQMRMEDVVGAESHPFYAWVRSQLGAEQLRSLKNSFPPGGAEGMSDEDLMQSGFPTWNFSKVLINADGELVAAFTSGDFNDRSNVQPELIEAIETQLAAS
jgi:glutathione peroxidase